MIRIAEKRDFNGIMALLHELNPDDPFITDGRDRNIFDAILQCPTNILIVAVEDEKVISTCYLNIIPNLTRNASPYAIIENVVTSAAFRNRGYGKAVIRFALDYAWQNGCYKVMLQTGRKEESTHRFYRSCGFKADEKTAYLARPK